MLDTSQNYMEREVLLLLRRLHEEDGAVTRERLTVMGRGRGLDVARSLMQLKALGLVTVVTKRPPLWRRIFGAKTMEYLHPAAQPEPVPVEAPAVVAGAPFEAEGALPPVMPESLAPVAEVMVPAIEAEVPTEVAVFAPPLDLELEAAPPIPDAEPLGVVPPAARPSRPAPVPQGFTDEIGGAPADFNLAPRLDPALVEGMRDFLGGLGLELTFAGEALAAQRLKGGMALGDAVMELVVFALAHAAHHESLSGPLPAAEELKDYGQALLEELERLTEAGEIGRPHFVTQRGLILLLADRDADRSAVVARLLADPIGGAAPPALLPEELRGVEEGLDDLPKDI